MKAHVKAAVGIHGDLRSVFQSRRDRLFGFGQFHVRGRRRQREAQQFVARNSQQSPGIVEGQTARALQRRPGEGPAGRGVDQHQLVGLVKTQDHETVARGDALHALAAGLVLSEDVAVGVDGPELEAILPGDRQVGFRRARRAVAREKVGATPAAAGPDAASSGQPLSRQVRPDETVASFGDGAADQHPWLVAR